MHTTWMNRCLELAVCGLGHVAPNPMVGCVIVHDGKIIGEGYHQKYGEAHAEVNAIASVKDKNLLPFSTLYVNLEPCAHHGKTPPCADLIITSNIKKVVIGTRDSYHEVAGKGIEKLHAAGIEVTENILAEECLWLNRRFFTFHEKQRPYIILKWAQTQDGFIAMEDYSSKWISNPYSRLLTHKWRGEEAGIMVGTNTAFYDNPRLDARDMSRRNPTRIILDKDGRIPSTHHIMDGTIPTIIFGKNGNIPRTTHNSQLTTDFILQTLHKQQIQSIIIEGGSKLLTSFVQQNLWDEARIFTSKTKFGKGIPTPEINGKLISKNEIRGDILRFFSNKEE